MITAAPAPNMSNLHTVALASLIFSHTPHPT